MQKKKMKLNKIETSQMEIVEQKRRKICEKRKSIYTVAPSGQMCYDLITSHMDREWDQHGYLYVVRVQLLGGFIVATFVRRHNMLRSRF